MGNSMHRLKEMLCNELDEIANSGPMNKEKLDIIDKLTHSIKSIATITAMEDGGYSSASGNSNKWYNGVSYGNSNNSYGSSYGNSNNSYANSNDNSYRRYSRDEFKGSLLEKLNHMMSEASSDKDREAIRRCIDQIGG